MTEYEYDDQGRMVRSVTVREPEFDAGQLTLLRAHQDREGSLNEFGIPLSIATDPANQFRWITDDAPTVDWAAYYLEAKKRQVYGDKDQGPNRAGHLWGVHLKPESE